MHNWLSHDRSSLAPVARRRLGLTVANPHRSPSP
jgi:hypothetical protein